jgi:hypothetical protein
VKPPVRIALGLAFIAAGAGIIWLQFSTGGLARRIGTGPLLVFAVCLVWASRVAAAAVFPKEDEKGQ